MADKIIHKMIDSHRQLRHDFMNDIQVISGYLQIGQADKALEYTRKAAGNLETFQPLSKILPPFLQSFFICFMIFLNTARERLHFEIEGDFSFWQEEDRFLAMYMNDLYEPMRDDIIGKRLEIYFCFVRPPVIEIKVDFIKDRILWKDTVRFLKGMTGIYHERFVVVIREETRSYVVLEIKKSNGNNNR